MKAGSIEKSVARRPIITATKQTVMPAVNTSASASMLRAVACLLFTHNSPTSAMTAMVASASPMYTSNPNTVYR